MSRCAIGSALMMMVILTLATSAAATQLKVATVAPDGSTWMNEARKGAEEIEQRTSGRVKLQFYPGGSMGSEKAVLRRIRIGQLHGTAMTGGSLAQVYPSFHIYALPLLFTDYEEVDFVRSHMDSKVLAGLTAETGLVSFGVIEGGFAYLMSNKAVNNISDLKGRKAWLPEGDQIAQAVFEAAGLSPIPLPLTDVLTGLQTGLVDSVAGPPVGAVALQWFTKVKFLTDIPLIYTYGTIVFSDKALARLSPADRQVVTEVMKKVCQRLDERNREENQAALEALKKQGVKVVPASALMHEEWKAVAAKATTNLMEQGLFPEELLAEAQAVVEQHRKDEAKPE